MLSDFFWETKFKDKIWLTIEATALFSEQLAKGLSNAILMHPCTHSNKVRQYTLIGLKLVCTLRAHCQLAGAPARRRREGGRLTRSKKSKTPFF